MLSYRTLTKSEFDMLYLQAEVFFNSGFCPNYIKNKHQAFAIILQGRELGVAPMTSLQNINVIQGKPSVSPQLMLALVKSSSSFQDMEIVDDGEGCQVTMTAKGKQPYCYTFSMAHAKSLGLTGRKQWIAQPEVMRKWRAIAGCARVAFPEMITGLYTDEEINGDDPVFDIIDPEEAEPLNIIASKPDKKTRLINRIREIEQEYNTLEVMIPPKAAKAISEIDTLTIMKIEKLGSYLADYLNKQKENRSASRENIQNTQSKANNA